VMRKRTRCFETLGDREMIDHFWAVEFMPGSRYRRFYLLVWLSFRNGNGETVNGPGITQYSLNGQPYGVWGYCPGCTKWKCRMRQVL
jgi:hypothetical protein